MHVSMCVIPSSFGGSSLPVSFCPRVFDWEFMLLLLPLKYCLSRVSEQQTMSEFDTNS